MCILVILRDRVVGWPLVVGSNRDEYRDRPWDGPRLTRGVLAPRDRRAGGTWIGLNRDGLLVALTNRPSPDPDPGRPSRGTLALDLLAETSLVGARERLERELRAHPRNPCQILLATAEEALVAVHPGAGGPVDVRPVPDGLHTLTNLRGLDELEHGGALTPVDLPPGSGLETALANMKDVLSLHETDGPPAPDIVCKHRPDRGTLSSTIVALPAASDRSPIFLMAPGAPCESAFTDLGGELGPVGRRPTG